MLRSRAHIARHRSSLRRLAPRLRTEVRAETARSIISRNRSPDIPFSQSINPYRGCEHGCSYCFARPSHAYLNLSPGLDFETRLFAKANAAELLRRELARPGYVPQPIALGINTDAYQPIERRWRITRQLVEVLLETRHPFSLITKNALIERDLDLMRAAHFNVIRVGESVWSTWEPWNGEFDLEWLQPVLDGAHARGIGVILGTPTYAVPPWLWRTYPEIAGDVATGRPQGWGRRQEVDITHAAFRFHAERVIRAMMEHLKDVPNIIGFQLDNETKSVRRFDSIRKAFYLLRRAQHSYGYRTHMPNVAFRKSDFMREQGYQGNLEYVRGEYDFLVNKYAAYGDTAVELDCDAWLIHDEPTDKAWHNAHLYLQASRKSLTRAKSMMSLMAMDHLFPHLSLIASLATLTYAILMQDWILTGIAGFALLLLLILRTVIAHKAIKHFDDDISILKLPFYEYGIIWRNLANKIRYWRADKNDFTSHKL